MVMKKSVVNALTIGSTVLLLVGGVIGGQAIAQNIGQTAGPAAVVEQEPSAPKPTVTPTPTVAPVAQVPAPGPVVEAPIAEPAPEVIAGDPEPVAEVAEGEKCPAGTTPNSTDGITDTSCMPDTCLNAPRGFPDPNFPECDYFYPPSYYR